MVYIHTQQARIEALVAGGETLLKMQNKIIDIIVFFFEGGGGIPRRLIVMLSGLLLALSLIHAYTLDCYVSKRNQQMNTTAVRKGECMDNVCYINYTYSNPSK